MTNSKSAAWYVLTVLFAINALNFFDRLIIGAVGEPIRKEFGLGDAALGLLATAFTVLYALVGIPFGRLADKVSRRKILSAGVFVWSLLTAASGLAQSFWQILLLRLGVGVGEASCAPAATSLIGDLFPKERRGTALSIFMLGLPIGIGLSFAVSGTIAKDHGWRAAFFVAGAPGILLSIAALFMYEPSRGSGEALAVGNTQREGSPYRIILSSPTMRWLILSGVLHVFALLALSFFMTPYLMRYHGLDIRDANLGSMLINGVFTLPGLMLSGVLGDAVKKRRANGGLMVAALGTLIAVPLFIVAIAAEPGNTYLFVFAMGGAFAMMYFYYANVYSAIQDVTEPGLRGTAMSIYFMAMYLLGGALGPYVIGMVSDYFTRQAAAAAGVIDLSTAALEPYRAAGLHSAMYIVPVICIALAGIMFAASRTVTKDVERLQEWIRTATK
jgi:MFS family permease